MSTRRTFLAVLLALAVVAAAATAAARGKRRDRGDDGGDLLGLGDVFAPEPTKAPARPAAPSEPAPREKAPRLPAVDVATPVEPRRGSGLVLGLVGVGAVVAGGAVVALRRRGAPPARAAPAPVPPPSAPARAAPPPRTPRVAPASPVPPPRAAPVPLPVAPAPPPVRSEAGEAQGRADGRAASALTRTAVLGYLLGELERTDETGDVVRLAPGRERAAGGKGCAYARGYLASWYAAAMGRDVAVDEERCDGAGCVLRIRWT